MGKVVNKSEKEQVIVYVFLEKSKGRPFRIGKGTAWECDGAEERAGLVSEQN